MTTYIQGQFKKDRESVFRTLYKDCYSAVAKKLRGHGVSREDVEDVFQDALIVLYEKIVQNASFQVDHPKAFLGVVAYRLWLKKQGSSGWKTEDWTDQLQQELHLDFYEETRSENRILHLLERAGQKCIQVLRAFYYHEWSLSEIARNFG